MQTVLIAELDARKSLVEAAKKTGRWPVRLYRRGEWLWVEYLEDGGKSFLDIRDSEACISWVDADMEKQNSRLDALGQAVEKSDIGTLGWSWKDLMFKVFP